MRNGYQRNFLGDSQDFIIDLPEPGLTLQNDILQPPGLPEGVKVVPYVNYSLLMSISTRQALYSAANVDNSKMKKVSGQQGRKWFIDDRIGRENQIPDYPYEGTQWDRGHLTRRTAVTWGDTLAIAVSASNDSCSFANACMQHSNFNEDEWRAVEDLVANFNISEKLTVFTGPVFTRADRFYIKEFGDYAVRIPSAFWKIIAYVDKNNVLSTQAYIFFQDLPAIQSSKARARLRVKNMQVTTTEVSFWTGLKFDQKLYDSNPLKFYNGPESISTKNHKDLLDNDPVTLSLDEGITGQDSIARARESFPLEDFYELIKVISWV